MRVCAAQGLTLAIALAFVGCDRPDGDRRGTTVTAGEMPAMETTNAIELSDWDARIDAETLERGRFDPAWRRVAVIDTTMAGDTIVGNLETFEQISTAAVNNGTMKLPLYGDIGGPSVLRAQILLDRALFSPGVIDGRYGKNTEKAVYWFQEREGLPTTGRLDNSTFERLAERAGGPGELIATRQLTEEDVEGPFVTIPDDIYAKSEMSCMCYENLTEKLAEGYHTSPAVLEALNPGVDLSALEAGMSLNVPMVRDRDAFREVTVDRIAISAEGFHVHALDANGAILFHFPTTLGSSFDPSPDGHHRVVKIVHEPAWHYQPAILASVDDSKPDAMIPPGPNNAVGVVWMALSTPHYGIHGTSAPETIGYTTSAGCVRLVNWDARFLSERIREGTPVEFMESGGPVGL